MGNPDKNKAADASEGTAADGSAEDTSKNAPQSSEAEDLQPKKPGIKTLKITAIGKDRVEMHGKTFTRAGTVLSPSKLGWTPAQMKEAKNNGWLAIEEFVDGEIVTKRRSEPMLEDESR